MKAIINIISDDGVEHGPLEMQPTRFHAGFMCTRYEFDFSYSELNQGVLDDKEEAESYESNYSE